MDNRILNTKMQTFAESRDMTIFGDTPCQNRSNSIYITITFEIQSYLLSLMWCEMRLYLNI